MTEQPGGPVIDLHPRRPLPPVPRPRRRPPVDRGPVPPRPSPSARRTAVEATRTTPVTPQQAAAGWRPWEAAVTQAENRMRTEIVAALRELEAANGAAGVILDRADADAAELGGQLRDAAWAAWHKYTAEADRLEQAILDPARRAYDQATTEAKARYDQAIATAQAAYQREIDAATDAQDRAKAFPKPG